MTDDAANGAPAEAPDGDPLAEALSREAELKDRLLRAVAETENVRRRAEREKQEASIYALTRFARDLLGVADNLARALQSVTPEARGAADPAIQNLIAGVELTEKELLRVFERFEIKRLDPKGEPFSAHLHQAIAQIPEPTAPAGTVVDVAQVGFTIGERLLRPAMVIVSAGSPAGEPSKGEPPRSEPGQTVDTSA